MALAHSLTPREGSSCPHLFRRPSHMSKHSPLVCPRRPSDLSLILFCVLATCPPGGNSTPVFYLRCTILVSKLSFRDQAWHKPILILWGTVLPCCVWYRFALEGSHTNMQGLGIMVKCRKNLASRLTAFKGVSYPVLMNTAVHGSLPAILPHENQCQLSQMPSKRATVSPSMTQEIFRPNCLLLGLCLTSP